MRGILVIFISLIAAVVIAMGQTDRIDAGSHDHTQPGIKESQNQPGRVAVLQVFYYAKQGKADEVFSHRQHVSDIVEKLGLPRGRVMRRVGGSDDQPDVLWECEFPNVAARDHFLEVAGASLEFVEARKYMITLVSKAERRDWEVQGPPR